MKFKLSFSIMALFLAIGLLMPVSVFSRENTRFPDRAERLKKEKTQSHSFEKPFGSGPAPAWGGGGDDGGLEGGGGTDGQYNDPSPISDGIPVFILLALFYGVIIQRNNKLKE